MKTPTDWPSECPPEDAEYCCGDYFHILQADPPGSNDLKTFHEKGRMLRHSPACSCMPYGLSVFTDKDDALHMQMAMPKLGEFIAVLRLTTQHGKVMLTPGQRPTHNTWWPSIDCVRTDCVASVEQVT